MRLALLVGIAAATDDACMTRLGDVLLPTCLATPCSQACCDALTFPEHAGCSVRWANTYKQRATEMLRRCPLHTCTVRRSCPFSTQTTDSPCFNPLCSALFYTGELTPTCSAEISHYCSIHTTTACDDFNANLEACGTSGTQWYDCSLHTGPDAQLEGGIHNYTLIPSRHHVSISWETFEWIKRYGCTLDATFSPIDCPCAIHDREPDCVVVKACVFDFIDPTPPDLGALNWIALALALVCIVGFEVYFQLVVFK